MSDNIGNIIGNLTRRVDNIEQGVHDSGETATFVLNTSGILTVRESEVVIEKRDYDTNNLVLILGHPTRGILGTNKLGTEADAFGAWSTVETITDDAVLVDVGRNEIRNWLAGDAPNGLTDIAVGIDDTTVTSDDTTLGSEIKRVSATSSRV